ncbi:hypothetical protein [Leifsonia sp. WHRI 6310E]|uniref:hypothetical protein n=1 Tax=Leifsonia sp. WHRI 6310E TaxID=3162562 RepID=UPI0032EAEFFB
MDETHLEVIPWMEPGRPPANITVMRTGTRLQAGTIISGTYPSGQALSDADLTALNRYARTSWDMPYDD